MAVLPDAVAGGAEPPLLRHRAVLRPGPRNRLAEAVLLTVHFGAYAAPLVWTMTLAQAVVFVDVHQGLIGLYLGCAFAPNHKGMALPGAEESGPAASGSNLAPRPGWPRCQRRLRRAELPDRAPSVPEHAASQPRLGATGRPSLLREERVAVHGVLRARVVPRGAPAPQRRGSSRIGSTTGGRGRRAAMNAAVLPTRPRLLVAVCRRQHEAAHAAGWTSRLGPGQPLTPPRAPGPASPALPADLLRAGGVKTSA